MDFCLIMIPRLDITNTIAMEDVTKTTALILTEIGDFLRNLKKLFLKILKNNSKYIRFSTETIRPKTPGASKKRGLNQKVKSFKGSG